MSVRFDHVAIACTNLSEAKDWLEYVFDAPMQPRGEHALMGTQNHLISMGEDAYLELIAVDPAVTPDRPRWFDLDSFRGMARPTNWILRCDDLDATLATAPEGAGDPVEMARGDYRWRMAVPDDGRLPFEGGFPALIEWQGPHPAPALPDHGLRIERLFLTHPRADALVAAIDAMGDIGIPVHVGRGAEPRLGFEISTPRGTRAF